jgi:hypothetical protein
MLPDTVSGVTRVVEEEEGNAVAANGGNGAAAVDESPGTE